MDPTVYLESRPARSEENLCCVKSSWHIVMTKGHSIIKKELNSAYILYWAIHILLQPSCFYIQKRIRVE